MHYKLCVNCGKAFEDGSAFCPFCGVMVATNNASTGATPSQDADVVHVPDEPVVANAFSSYSGETDNSSDQHEEADTATPQKSKVAAGLIALFLGGLGWHKLYLGYHKEWLIMMALWFLGWNVGIVGGGILFSHFGSTIVAIISGIEGIIYLTKSDEVFQKTYVENQKPWF